jgi:hypothetical protein
VKIVLKWVVLVMVVLFLAAQVYRPSKTNLPVDKSKTRRATPNTRLRMRGL